MKDKYNGFFQGNFWKGRNQEFYESYFNNALNDYRRIIQEELENRKRTLQKIEWHEGKLNNAIQALREFSLGEFHKTFFEFKKEGIVFPSGKWIQ